MKELRTLFEKLAADVRKLAQGNAVVAKSISVGNRHVIPLCELKLGFGGGGGTGELLGENEDKEGGQGMGVGGGAKATPVVVVVVENGVVRVQSIGR
ncbi:MAG: spore germination protein GerW family protein [Myxococcota bacterium]|jgi:uncharacterized spore protein YtfJ|nr:spore germination protein GerW family protein [Myxococcota bacterium]